MASDAVNTYHVQDLVLDRIKETKKKKTRELRLRVSAENIPQRTKLTLTQYFRLEDSAMGDISKALTSTRAKIKILDLQVSHLCTKLPDKSIPIKFPSKS